MTEDQARAFLESPLEYPGLVVRQRGSEALRLSRRPAFDPEAVWSLCRVSNGFVLRRIVYAVECDKQGRPRDHNTFGAESPIPKAQVEEILDRLGQISLRPFARGHRTVGIDGCTYHVRVAPYYKQAELSWWCEAPEDWSLLRDWYGTTILEFETHLPRSTVPIQDKHPWVE